MGRKYNPLIRICHQMTAACNQHVRMVAADDATNHFDVNTRRTVPIEYNRIPSRVLQYSQTSTDCDDNRLPQQQYVT
jgi:hypothetical protein